MNLPITPEVAIFAFVVSAAAILISIYCTIIVGTTEIWSLIWISIVPMLLDLVVFHGFFDYCSYMSNHGEIRSNLGRAVATSTNQMVLLVALALAVSALLRLRLIKKIASESLTPFSVGEALDTLPMGIAFVGDSGIILQSNDVMDDLSFVLTRRMISNGNDFWERIESGNVAAGYSIEPGENPIVIGPNDFVWMFKRERLSTKVGEIYQILAMDVANEQSLLKELETNNEKLGKMNERLKRYSDIVDDAIRQEERLQTKIRIHDEMGEALIATKMLIANEESPISEQEVLDRWNRDIALLRQAARQDTDEDESRGKAQIERLQDAAKHLGIDLQLVGDMPNNFKAMELICVGIQETMTNAIQHAKATQMYVVIGDDENGYVVSYSNNGEDFSGKFKEGGGLTLFRKSAEKLGATVEYVSGPRFNIVLRIPYDVLFE